MIRIPLPLLQVIIISPSSLFLLFFPLSESLYNNSPIILFLILQKAKPKRPHTLPAPQSQPFSTLLTFLSLFLPRKTKMGDNNNDGLGLSLGLPLGCGTNHSSSSSSLHLNLMQTPSEHHRGFAVFGFSDRNATSFRRGIDVNQAPAAVGDCEDENGVSSPNSTVSSQSGKRSERGDDNEAERTSCSLGGSDDEDGNGSGDTSRKKLRLTKEQSLLLEDLFKDHNTLNTRQKQELARKLNLSARKVEVWFQNRRARTKLKQTEVDCEQLRKCCENLTAENRRLQKEVQELRALNLSPQFYMQMTPPTTLTMCPSCQCVGVSSPSPSTLASATTGSSTVLATGPTGHQGQPSVHRPVPISPWATLPIPQHRLAEAPASQS